MQSTSDSEERTFLHDSVSSWGSGTSDYQTFLPAVQSASTSSRSTASLSASMPLWWDVLSWLFGHHPTCRTHAYMWRLCGIMAFFIVVLQTLERTSLLPSSSTGVDEWEWDMNHYNIKHPKDQQQQQEFADPNVLVIQLSSPKVRHAAEIAARPNRAYAKMWGMDYGLHYSEWEQEHCRDVVQILSEVEHRQNNPERKEALKEQEEREPTPRYTSMLFLPPDVIITNLEMDVKALLGNSTESVVAYGKDSGVVLWNLDHDMFQDLLRDLKRDIVDRSTRCHSIDRLVKRTNTVPSNAVEELEERDGFVEPSRFLKYLEGSDKGRDALEMLNHIADSVCYRYYPKCEVVS